MDTKEQVKGNVKTDVPNTAITSQEVHAGVKALRALMCEAHRYPGEGEKAPVTAEINGRTFSVQYLTVNRKCYDGFSTPTLQIKVDGKRISRENALALVKSGEAA